MRVALKVKFELEQPLGTGVGYELAKAARSCTCYSKLTHKGLVYVYDNAEGELNTLTIYYECCAS